jgi:DNA primase
LRIPDEKVDEIRSVLDIVDVVSDYVSLKKKGSNFFGLCPFHNEKTPSFSVNPERGIYKCFGCGKGGNVFSFLMEIERIGFVEAVRLLAERAGVDLPDPGSDTPESGTEVESIYHALRLAGRFFHSTLMHPEIGADARRYLEDRGFSDETVRKFGIGFAPDRWDALLKHAESSSTPVEVLEKAGLVIKSEKGDGHYDRFRGRVMFPLFTHVGQVVGFTGRVLNEDAKVAKYVNSPETKVYHKGRILYGLNFSRNEVRRREEIYLVEGNTDVVSLYQAGITNVAATSGTALTTEQVKLLGRYTNTVVIVFDADEAGVQASLRSLDLMLAAGMKVFILSVPDGGDPDMFVRQVGHEGFTAYAEKQREDFVTFRLRAQGFQKGSGDPESDWDSIRPVLDSIALIPNSVRQEGYLRLAAEQTGMLEGTLRDELTRILKRKPRRAASSGGRQERKTESPTAKDPSSGTMEATEADRLSTEMVAGERDLIRLMLSHGERLIGYVLANMSLEEFSEGAPRSLVSELLSMYQKGTVQPERLLAIDSDQDIRDFAAGLMIQLDQPSPNWRHRHDIEVPPLDADAKRSAADAMRRLKLKRIDSAISVQNRRIRQIEQQQGDTTEGLKQLHDLQKLKKRLRTLEFVEWG